MFQRWRERRARRILLSQRREIARREQSESSRFRDPIEDDARYAHAVAEADRLAEHELNGRPLELGFCHLFWATKQRILKEKFAIEWFSPREMNPHIRFD
jgi:hypothetical protein